MSYTKYYGYSRKNYIDCIKTIEQANYAAARFINIVAIFMISCLVIMSLMLDFLSRFKFIYFATDFLLVALYLFSRFCSKFKIKSTFLMYMLISIILGFGIALGMPYPDETSTAFPVLLVIIPIFFIDNSARMSFFTAGIFAIYCIITYQYKNAQASFWDIFDGVLFCVISFIAHYYVNSRIMRGMLSDKKRDDVLSSYRKAQKELKAKVQRDSLTGLYNRSAFIELATMHLEKCCNSGCPAVLGILDLDHFKDINDTYGHQTGDRVIFDVADVLRCELRNGDIVGRLGGDEYIFILSDISDEKVAADITQRVLNAVAEVGRSKRLPLHCSAGLVVAAKNEMKFERLYQKADIALYQAKNGGRNRFSFYA